MHCREPYVPWIADIPPSWAFSVYETCGQNVSERSVQFQNAGPEECTPYLDYIIQNYDNLPVRSVFLQSDAFRDLGKEQIRSGNFTIVGHSPFRNVSDLNAAIQNVSVSGGRTFVHFGWGYDRFVYPKWGGPDGYTRNYTPEFLEDFGWNSNATGEANSRMRTRPGAVFVVHRDRILAHNRTEYERVRDKILANRGNEEARRQCCGLERMWHAVFGEPVDLPVESTVDHLYSSAMCWGVVGKGGNCSDPGYPYAQL